MLTICRSLPAEPTDTVFARSAVEFAPSATALSALATAFALMAVACVPVAIAASLLRLPPAANIGLRAESATFRAAFIASVICCTFTASVGATPEARLWIVVPP